MKKITLFLNVCLMACVIMFSSCAKDGETGPQGPAGPQGAQGPQGNANVKSDLAMVSNWIYDSNSAKWVATIIDNNITQEIADRGMVMVYLVESGSNIALPVTLYPSGTYSRTINYFYSQQQVTINIGDSDKIQPGHPGTVTFRVVKIAPAARKANPNVDWTDYNQVKKCLNIQE